MLVPNQRRRTQWAYFDFGDLVIYQDRRYRITDAQIDEVKPGYAPVRLETEPYERDHYMSIPIDDLSVPEVFHPQDYVRYDNRFLAWVVPFNPKDLPRGFVAIHVKDLDVILRVPAEKLERVELTPY